MEVSEGYESMGDVCGFRKAGEGFYMAASCAYTFEMEDPLERCAIQDFAIYWVAYRRVTS
jgi:hypothetical protein